MADSTDDTSRDNSCPCCLSATGGTGLGLAIVKHSLYHHQAQLDITARRVLAAALPSASRPAASRGSESRLRRRRCGQGGNAAMRQCGETPRVSRPEGGLLRSTAKSGKEW